MTIELPAMTGSVLAASTTASIGLVLLVVISLGAIAAIYFNTRASKAEIGSEIELAANRKPYLPDEELEGKKLDVALTLGLVLLTLCAVALPAYFIAEPGRQESARSGKINRFENEGEELYTELCSSCHGSIDQGGNADFTIQTDSGKFIQTVSWNAPALHTAGWRFSEEDLTDILNYGRQFSPMPAWGAPGGGPNTEQEIEALIAYINSEEVKPTIEEMRAEVDAELELEMAAFVDTEGDYVPVVDGEPALNREADCVIAAGKLEGAEQTEALEACEEIPLAVGDDGEPLPFYETEGEALFNLGLETGFSQGAYSCARCHTPGASYGADDQLSHFPVFGELDGEAIEIKPVVDSLPFGQCVFVEQGAEPDPDINCSGEQSLVEKRLEGELLNEPPRAGAGAVGKPLVNIRDRCTKAQHITLIRNGSEQGVKYCNQGQGSGGQMPGFAEMLSDDHIQAIVEYERTFVDEDEVLAEAQAG